MQETVISGTILVVDDQEALLSVAEDMLTAKGMHVLLASNGVQAISIFEENCDIIDVVLLDLKMPGMSGYEVFAQLKTIAPEIEIVITSGYSREETQNYFEPTDTFAYLQKPYRFHSLTDTIKSALQKTT